MGSSSLPFQNNSFPWRCPSSAASPALATAPSHRVAREPGLRRVSPCSNWQRPDAAHGVRSPPVKGYRCPCRSSLLTAHANQGARGGLHRALAASGASKVITWSARVASDPAGAPVPRRSATCRRCIDKSSASAYAPIASPSTSSRHPAAPSHAVLS